MIIGKLIDQRYKVISKIAEGGMADIFLAHDQIFKTNIVLKVLKKEYIKDKYITQFKHEVDCLAELNHEGIIKVLDYKEIDNLHFIVMEYLDGITLKDLINKQETITPKMCVDIMSKVASALKHAHSFGLIHCDLKPQNIMILKNGSIKIMDFGISTHVDEVLEYDADSDNTVMGSVHYISPEQVKGEKISLQSDIYSLGIIMYEMLSGKVPYNGTTAVDIALMHITQHIGNVSDLNPLVPQSLSNVIIRATSPDIKLRHQDIQSFEYDLTTCLIPKRLNEEKLTFVDRSKEDSLSKTQLIDLNNSKIKKEINKKNISIFKNSDNWDWKKIAIIGGIVTFLCMLLLFITVFSAKNKMPNLQGKTYEEAKNILRDELNVTIGDLNVNYESNPKIEAKKVWKQYPYANQQVDGSFKPNDFVITLNDIKIEEYTLKNYVGMQLDVAKKELEDKHINVLVKYSDDNTLYTNKNQIILQSKKPNSIIKTKDTITFDVLRENRVVKLPSLSNLKVEELAKFASSNAMQINNLDPNNAKENEVCYVTSFENGKENENFDTTNVLTYHSSCNAPGQSLWDKFKSFFGFGSDDNSNSKNDENSDTQNQTSKVSSLDNLKKTARESIMNSNLSFFQKMKIIGQIYSASDKHSLDKVVEEAYR